MLEMTMDRSDKKILNFKKSSSKGTIEKIFFLSNFEVGNIDYWDIVSASFKF